MPPKKKKRNGVVNTRKLGIGRDFVTKTYSGTNVLSPDQLLNGHVLYLYHVSESSLTKTENAVKSRFSGESSDLPPLKNKIRRLVDRTFEKFHKLTNPDEFSTFRGICKERFSIVRVKRERLPENTGVIVDALTAGTSAASTEDRSRCAKCTVLRGRLKRAIEIRKDAHEQHTHAIQFLRQTVFALNRKIKRKDEIIKGLKEKCVTGEIDKLREVQACCKVETVDESEEQ